MRADERDRSSLPAVPLIRLRNTLWIFVLGGLWVAGTLFGTPHLRVSYRWNGSERSPYYIACNYWGLTTFRSMPPDGRCPLIVLARSNEER